MSSVGPLVAAIILIVVGFILGYAAKKNHIHQEIDDKIEEVKGVVKKTKDDLSNKVDEIKKDLR